MNKPPLVIGIEGRGELSDAACGAMNYDPPRFVIPSERELSEAMRARSRGIYAFPPSNSGNHPCERSLQAGFMLTINRTFLILLQRLICFSRAIALLTYL